MPRTTTRRTPAASSATDRYLSIESTCRRLNKWRTAVKDLLLDGEIEYERVDGRIFLLRASVEEYAERNGIAAPEEEA